MRVAFGRTDAELLLVVLLWAFNLAVVKVALREMEPLAFNMIRFACAGLLLLALTLALEGSIGIRRQDWARVAILGAVGHTLYQIAFVHGLARTTASSTALIFGTTPVVVAILTQAAGHERVGLIAAAGAALAFGGVYLIAAGGAAAAPSGDPSEARMAGDLLVLGAVICWSLYTVMSRGLLQRYSPLRVTTVTMLIGGVLMAPVAAPELARQRWGAVSRLSWAGLAYSFVFALAVSYVLWYRSVKRVGNLRTAVYSNLVPVFGAAFGITLLGERLTAGLATGAACILAGIVMTRMGGAVARAAGRREARSTSP